MHVSDGRCFESAVAILEYVKETGAAIPILTQPGYSDQTRVGQRLRLHGLQLLASTPYLARMGAGGACQASDPQ